MRGAIALLAATALVAAAGPAPAPVRPHATGHSERLAARARRGDRAARAALVEEHMGLIRSIAGRYRNLGVPDEDLVQEGAIGLLTSVDEYDPARGTSFSTYAFWRVRAAVTHAVTARGSLVRIPRPVLERRRQVRAARDLLTETGHEPSLSELATATSLPVAAVAEALAPSTVVSLDQPLADGTPLCDHLAGSEDAQMDTRAVSAQERRMLRGALRRLRPRKEAIVKRHYGIDGAPETLVEIASDLHLSPERTRALKDEALRELAADLIAVAGA
jgi:RNA polymerase sigma factor (sigma-70 family)